MAQGARTLRPEDEVSHYRIVGPLGHGGMGEVYLAQDQTLERNVALKILPPDLVRSDERVRRFMLEAKSASSLNHPNIVTIYEIGHDVVRSPASGESSAVHFISMELVSGKTLSTLIHEDRTDIRTLLGYLAQAAEGLAKAHVAGIVHRDLKPGNIMVSADGFAKVLDFGLAKLTEKRAVDPDASSAPTMAADATQEGVVVGTAGYMSPEQVQGKVVDHRSDLFSFGCILYEATTREKPFAAETGVETMHKILHDVPTPVEQLNPQAPAELRRLIRRCLAKNADQRLQSMKDLAIELREIVDEYDSLSPSGSSGAIASGTMPAAPARRGRAVFWIAAAVVAVAATIALWLWLPGSRQSQPFQNMRVTTQTSRGDVLDCVLSPDGRYLAYIAGRLGSLTLRVRQVATGSDVEILPVADVQIRNPSFSPDGNYLFYTLVRPERQNYQALYQVPSLGGTPRERAFNVESRVSVAPDGRQAAFWRRVQPGNENGLVLLDLESGKERVLAKTPPTEAARGAPAWSPDGKRIAGVLLRPAPDLISTLTIFDPVTGRRQDFAKLGRTLLSSIAWARDGKAIVSTGQDLKASITNQVFVHSYPEGRTSRVTNDFNQYEGISASLADETVAALRSTRISNVWMADGSGAPAWRLTAITTPDNAAIGAVGLDSANVLYCAAGDRSLQLWAVGTRGGAARPLTAGGAHSLNARSASGVVVYDHLDSTGMHVWRMGMDGGDQRQLTTGAGEQCVALARDGQHAVSNHYDVPGKISVVSTADGRIGAEKDNVAAVIGFSPDSRSLLVAIPSRDAQGLVLFDWTVLPVAGGPETARVRLPALGIAPRWTPDGHGLTFINRADPAWNVYRQSFDGGQPVPVTRFKEGRVVDFQWSRDGRKIAAQVANGESMNLWIADADGSHPVQVTQFTTDRLFGFSWMPDSRRVTLYAGVSTSDAVLIRDFR